MKKIFLFLAACCFHVLTQGQTWEWVHAEPNGPAFYTAEDDAAHHIKTDASGNVYILGSFLGYLYLNNNIVTQGNGSYLAKYDPTGTLIWYKLIVPDYGNTSGDTYIKASDLVVNSSGVYITGRYNYSFGYKDYFNNCSLIVSTSKAYKIANYSFTSSIYDVGFFIAKLNTDGEVIWNKTATDFYTDEHNCLQPATCSNCGSAVDFPVLTSDPNNNLTVAFTYSPGANIGASGLVFDGKPIASESTNPQGRDILFINLNSDGAYRWANTAYTNPYYNPINNGYSGGELDCNSIVADHNGNIFITGQAGDHAVFGSDVVTTNPLGGALRYIAKLSSSGTWVFEKTLTKYSSLSSLSNGYSMDANPNLLTVDGENNVYMLVNLMRLPIYEPQYILETAVPDPSANSVFLLKISNTGNATWVKQFGMNSSQSYNHAFGINCTNNDLYITGTLTSGRTGTSYYQFGNLSVPSVSNSEYFVARSDLDGNFKWANTFSGVWAAGFSVAVSGNNVYTGGAYKQKISSLGNFDVDRTATTSNTAQEPFFGKLKDQYIKIGAISQTTLCPGATFSVPFTSYGLTLSGNNTFTAQLSDVNGDFTSAVNIGSLSSTGSGTITATLPANLPMGSSGYKIRIVSSDLLNTGLPYYAYADIGYSITVGSQTFYQDADGDGYGNPAIAATSCPAPEGYVTNNTDCNDNDATTYTNAPELCDGKDNNCDGQIDEGCSVKPKILLVASEQNIAYIEDVKNKLLATGNFSAIDKFQILMGNTSVPSVEQLKQYNAVLVWSDYSWSNAAGLGDNLAEYINNGGGVVTAVNTFRSNFNPPFVIGGAFANSTYQVIVPDPNTNGYGTSSLGQVLLPSHFIMQGVNSMTADYRTGSLNLSPNSYIVAKWGDGLPLIAVKDDAGPAHSRRVDLGFFPPSRDVYGGSGWDPSTDGAKIMANALLYVAKSQTVSAAGGALHFDGINDYVDMDSSFHYQNFTVEMWVKPGATQMAYANIIDNNHTDLQSWVVQQKGNNLNEYYFGGSAGVSPTFRLTADEWQHLAIVSTANTKTIYVNGVPVVTQKNTPRIIYNGSEHLRLGNWGLGGRNWNGSMDEVRFWDRALCASEIQNNMMGELPGAQIGLVSYYKLNQGVIDADNSIVNTAHDEISNFNNGILNNFALSGDVSNWIEGHVTGVAGAFQNPTVSISAIGGDKLTCDRSSVNLTATGNGTFLWSTGETTASISLTTPGVYTVALTAASGCTATDSMLVIQDTIAPGISIFTPSTVFTCASPGIGNAIGLFVNGDGITNVTDSNQTVIQPYMPGQFSIGAPGIYTATVTGANGCKSMQQIIYTSDFTPPAVAITNQSGSTELSCSVSNVSVVAAGGSSYAWDGGNSPNTAENSFTMPGVYSVIATGYNGCTATDTITILQAKDVTPPLLTPPSPVTITTSPGLCTGTTTLTPPTVVDNCNSIGNALSFNGGYVDVPDNPVLTPFNEWTLETWVKRTTTDVQEGLIEKYSPAPGTYGYLLRIFDNKAFAGFVFTNSGGYFLTGATKILPNEWYHLATTFNRTTGVMKLYVNGVLDAQLTGITSLPVTPNAGSLKIGARGDDANFRLSDGGIMDEVRIWNVERTEAQIQAAMNSEMAAQLGLVALYHLNEGVAGSINTAIKTATDVSGNGNNGTLIDFALTGATSNWVSGKNSGLTLTNNAPATYPVGNTIVTWTATDEAGNSATATQTITVTDNQKPKFPALADVVINNAVGQCYATNNLATPIVSDNCGVPSVTSNAATTFPIGVTLVKWTATDVNGNIDTVQQKVTVVDVQKPVFPTLPDVTINNVSGQCYGNNILATPQVTDNCGIQSLSNNAGSTFPVGVTIVTWTATDIHGNMNTATQKVTVVDWQSPTITSCPIIPIQCYVANNTYTLPLLTATDNCGIQSISYIISGATSRNGTGANASGIFNAGVNTVSWTVRDVNGNSSTCTSIVKIDKVDASIPDAYATNITSTIGNANTIYIGYGGSSVNLSAQASSSLTPNSFTYRWTIGSASGTLVGTSPSITVAPSATTVYYLTIKDANSCKPLYQVTKQINVVNIVCGSGKITACIPQKNGTTLTSCVSSAASSISKLPAGWYLGQCTSAAVAARMSTSNSLEDSMPQTVENSFEIKVAPNPSSNHFTISIKSSKNEGVDLYVVDASGRRIEIRSGVAANGTLQIGHKYRPGMYIVEITQGEQRKHLKLIKGSE